jgi:hypothetical protein
MGITGGLAMFILNGFTQGDYAALLKELALRERLDLNLQEERQLAVNMLNGWLLLDLTAHVKRTL